MAKEYIHFRLRSPKGCVRFRTIDPGRRTVKGPATRVAKLKGMAMTLCMRKPRKGEIPARGRKYESEVQRIIVRKDSPTFKKDMEKAKSVATTTCRRLNKKLVKVGEDYKCK